MSILKAGKLKKAAAMGLVILIAAGDVPAVFAPKEAYGAEFSMGVENHWAETYMRGLYSNGILSGDENGNMNPDKNITRAEFVSMINRAFGYSASGKNPFKDISGTEWYAKDIVTAYNEGYFFGSGKSISDAASYLTREQAVSLVCRNLKIENQKAAAKSFADSKMFSSWSADSINAMTAKNYISGYTDGTFRPGKDITRAEVAKILSDSLGTVVSKSGSTTLGIVNGNVTITSSGAILKNTTIKGDLYITGGVGLGYLEFINVTVLGEVVVSGSGESNVGGSSIGFDDCNIKKLTVDGPAGVTVSIKIQGGTEIENTTVKTDAYLEESMVTDTGFREVTLNGAKATALHLSGELDKVTVLGAGNLLFLDRGEILELIVDEEAKDSVVSLNDDTEAANVFLDVGARITGYGDVGHVKINYPGAVVDMLPDEIVIRPGITAKVYGREMTSKDAEEASSLPRILSGYPRIEEIVSTSVKSVYMANKPGIVYWALTLGESGAASAEDILNPSGSKEIVASGHSGIKSREETRLPLNGLKNDTQYILSALLVDERGDVSGRKKETFTTADNTAPKFVSGYPKTAEIGNTAAVIAAVPTKDCALYWAVFNKGSAAPTAYELKKLNAGGSISRGSSTGCRKNEYVIFSVGGLAETASYDFYILATDGTNDSAVTKLTFTTADKTPPEFLAGYPRADKSTEKSVDIKYNLNEASTVYYAVFNRGTQFPPLAEGETVSPGLDSEAARQAVLTGNNAVKSGKASAKANNEGSFSISGLGEETSYDVYITAQDAGQNTSPVKMLYIKTKDTKAPTAELCFDDSYNGQPYADSAITILFSEEVWDSATNAPMNPAALFSNIKLYDLSALKRTEIAVDYSKVTVGAAQGKTRITFPPEATGLNSGNKYEFELNKIADTSGNKMADKTLLPWFITVAPYAELSKTTNPGDMDITFELSPKESNTADNVLFDMLIMSDTTVLFELYQKNYETNLFEEITGYKPLIIAGEGISLHYILDRKIAGKSEFVFERFNLLQKREYGIKFLQVDGNSSRDTWNNTVNMEVKCLMGSKTSLSIAAGNPVGGLNSAIAQGAIQVHYPSDFKLVAAFTDIVIPGFAAGYPKLDMIDETTTPINAYSQVGDVYTYPLVRADKKCVMYYLIAPKGAISALPSALGIINGSLKPQGGISGSFVMENGDMEYGVEIKGLAANTEYDIYFVLKGTPAEPSPVVHKVFKTRELYPPVLNPVYASNRGENFADISITADSDCTIDWIVYPSYAAGGPQVAGVTADIIRNRVEDAGAYKPVVFGSVSVKLAAGKATATTTVKCSNLERNIYYNFYAVAKKPQGGGDSILAVVENITPADVTPPSVTTTTVIINNAQSYSGQPYYGSVNLVFSEPMYYIRNEDDPLSPLTITAFRQGLNVLPVPEDPEDISAVVASYEAPGADAALTSIVINFKKARHNHMLSNSFIFCDKNRNILGKMQMVFVDMENSAGENRRDSYWKVTFIKNF